MDGIEAIVADQLAAVRDAMLSVENGVGQDDHEGGWSEALMAAGGLADAADTLRDRIADEYRKRES